MNVGKHFNLVAADIVPGDVMAPAYGHDEKTVALVSRHMHDVRMVILTFEDDTSLEVKESTRLTVYRKLRDDIHPKLAERIARKGIQ